MRAALRKPGELDAAGELVRTVQQIERREIIDAADVIAPVAATAEQDAGVAACRGLAHLHVKMIGMERHLAGDGDAAFVRAQVEGAGREAERRGELEQAPSGVRVEQTLAVGIVGHALAEIEPGCAGAGHGRGLRERGRGRARRALSFPAGFTPLPAFLSLSRSWGWRACEKAKTARPPTRGSPFRKCASGHRRAVECDAVRLVFG